MNKFNVIKKLLTDHYKKNIIIHMSPDNGYRSRVEFGFTENVFTMYDNKNKIFLTTFDIAKKEISTLMPKLLEEIKFNDAGLLFALVASCFYKTYFNINI